MKFESSWNLKWITGKEPAINGQAFTIVKKCVLTAKNPQGIVVGVTVFDPRDLSAQFIEKVEQRKKRPEMNGCTFHLFLPNFLKHRLSTLATSETITSTTYTAFVGVDFKSGIKIRERLKVVNVDDSPVLLKFLKHTIEELEYVDIVAQVSDPKTAAQVIKTHQPDVVTMDIQMPGKTGVEVVKDLLGSQYFPVLMISSLAMEEGSLVFEALNSGAFDYIQKPKLDEKEHFKSELEEKMLLAIDSGGSVHKRIRGRQIQGQRPKIEFNFADNLLWCLGASTGGTQALTQVFTSFPTEIPPTLVVQHIPPVFSKSFAESLNSLCPFNVKEAENGDIIKKNNVYIAPGGKQMSIERVGGDLKIIVNDDPPVNRFKPSVDYMFLQVSKLTRLNIVAGVLTGMGKDGAQGLLTLREKGARTVVQNEETCAVYGMPRAAYEIGAAEQILPLDQISHFFLEQSSAVKKAS